MSQEKYTYEDFLKIVEKLRSENGCPWDKEQTHESLRPCMIEEAYEVTSAISLLKERNIPDNLKEELGDVMLQVVMHSQIAKEEGYFAMEDVIQDIAEKMVRRHPHVFGETKADHTDQVLRRWEEIKAVEKEKKDWIQTPLTEIPKEFPSLLRAVKVIKKAKKTYNIGEDKHSSIQKIRSLSDSLNDSSSQDETKEIMTAILMQLCNIAEEDHINIEQALADQIDQWIKECEQ